MSSQEIIAVPDRPGWRFANPGESAVYFVPRALERMEVFVGRRSAEARARSYTAGCREGCVRWPDDPRICPARSEEADE